MAHEQHCDYFAIKFQKEKVAVIVVIILFVETMDASATACSSIGTMLTAKPFVNNKLTSPGYPNSYSAGLNCEWIISASLGHIVKLTFTDFELAFNQDPTCIGGDFVELRDGPSLSDDLIKRACSSVGDQEQRYKPYYSSGQHMRIVFKSHPNSLSWKGFNALYTAVKLVTSCFPSNTAEQNNNILLTNTTGAIFSPDFPRKYTPNINCTWIIKLPSTNNTLSLAFDEFKLDSSRNPHCRKNVDSVEIFIGAARRDDLLGRYCSKRPPPEKIFSTGRRLIVVFRSTENYLPKSGFSASYKSLQQSGIFGECLKENSKNEIRVSAGIGGVITSPQFPQNYPDNMECVWTITATAGERLKFVFLGTFDLEQGSDYVEIRDGLNNTSFLLGKFSQAKPDKPVYSSGPHAFVRFKTDQVINYKGFYLMYEAVKQACFPRRTSLLASPSNSNEIKSPNFPNPYPEGFTCEWVISAPEGHFVKLHFRKFLLQYKSRHQAACTNGDYVELRDGSPSSEVIKHYCSSGKSSDDAKSAYVFSTGQAIYLKFKSDLESPNNKGFILTYTAIKQATTCSVSNTPDQNNNLVINSHSGRISLQTFPPSGCTWNIKLPDRNNVVNLTIPVIDVGFTNDSDCPWYSYVQIFDGFEAKEVSLGFFCSASRPPAIYTTGSRATIALVTSNYKPNLNKEFVAVFKAINNTGITGMCERQHHANYITVFSSGGAIVSPNFPRNYPNYMECFWTITVSSKKKIKFQFLGSFGVVERGCSTGFLSNNDYVSIKDGPSRQSKSLGKFCRGKPADPVLTSGPSAVVEFSSDSGGSYKGFYLIYEEVKASAVSDGYCSPYKTSRQRFVLSRFSGSISSPDYPNKYVTNIECIWVISVSSDLRVQLNLKDLDITYYYASCNSGYLEVRDGDNSFSALIGKYCGNEPPGTLYSTGRHMWVKFTSYGATKTRGKGFYASYTSVAKETSSASALTVVTVPFIIIGMIVVIIVIFILLCCWRRYHRERNYRSVAQPGAVSMSTIQNRSPRPQPSAPNRTADIPSNLPDPVPSAPTLPTTTTQGQRSDDSLPNYDDLPPPPPYPGVVTDQPQYPLPGEQYPWQPSAPKC